jgi:3-oxoadipate enol-lactonase
VNFIEANGVAIRYELNGAVDRTLVLAHEMGGSLESWDEVAPRLAATRRVLRYDARGAGLSQKVRGELTLDTMADDIAALLDTLANIGQGRRRGYRRRRGDRAAFRRPIPRTHQRGRGW